MDVDSSQRRMAAYMRDHQDKVVGRWTDLVLTGLRGRSSAAELRREFDDLYSLVIRAMSGADEHAPGELRVALAELSRSRARNGFSPTETALAVFALKDAVYELVADAAELVPEFLVFSRMMDDLGLHTFETYAATRVSSSFSMTSWVRAESSVPISGTAMTPSHSLITGVDSSSIAVAWSAMICSLVAA